jgi:glycerol-3-phosphate dehydrogenase
VRYLAQGRLRLVREALRERAIILRLAPHLAQPQSFVVPGTGWLSWAWTGLGLKLYQYLARALSLGKTVVVSQQQMTHALPGVPTPVAGMRYWDGQFEDARLALALAKTARQAGAMVHNHMRVTALASLAKGWQVSLLDERSGQSLQVQAACVVNATGVWVDGLRQMALKSQASAPAYKPLVTPSQGVHLVVKRELLPIREAVLIPHTDDGRVLFAVPWLGATVIGTTDTPRVDAPLEPRPLDEELAFLFAQTERSLGLSLARSDVQMSREHLIVRDAPGFYTVTGGKWTTYRSIAADVLQHMERQADLPTAPTQANTEQHRLVGAPAAGRSAHSVSDAPGLHLWGSEAEAVQQLPGPQNHLGMGLTEAMVRFAARSEWALTVEDMLARRWRALFLDARQAARMAPAVAALLQEETGLDPQLDAFLALCKQYTLAD